MPKKKSLPPRPLDALYAYAQRRFAADPALDEFVLTTAHRNACMAVLEGDEHLIDPALAADVMIAWVAHDPAFRPVGRDPLAVLEAIRIGRNGERTPVVRDPEPEDLGLTPPDEQNPS